MGSSLEEGPEGEGGRAAGVTKWVTLRLGATLL